MGFSLVTSKLINIRKLIINKRLDRDIKLQNILFQFNSHDPRTLKIVDFGLAKVLRSNATTRDFCGSLGYIAPEIYQRKQYRFEVDMFAFGVLLFRLLSGERPFPSNHKDVLERNTIELRYNVLGKDWQNVSNQAKDLIRHLLINRQERWTAAECLQHEWFSSHGTSVLRADLSMIGDRSDGGTRSRAFLQVSAAPASLLSYFILLILSFGSFIHYLQSRPRYQQTPLCRRKWKVISSGLMGRYNCLLSL